MSEMLQKLQDLNSVIHLLRAPVGGLFRHVYDLIREQKKLGLKLGLICDAKTGNKHSATVLNELKQHCELGVYRISMGRTLGWSDVKAVSVLAPLCAKLYPSIIHGHGAKGGAYARLIAKRIGAKSVYTPHGGSLHYSMTSPVGIIYLFLERILKQRTDGLIFESQFSENAYIQKMGRIPCLHQVIHNGLHRNEFLSIVPDSDCRDFVFIGEIRKLKGIEILLKAMSELRPRYNSSLLIVGDGPDLDWLKQQVRKLGLGGNVTLSPPIYPATRAFAMGRCILVPSLAESFPYIVLEAVAARVPVITTRVGGIPEIFGPYADQLIQAGEEIALTRAMEKVLVAPEQTRDTAGLLQDFVSKHYKVETMGQDIVRFYEKVSKSL
jgi:glycosyltransferase involved in cell wall biosynthesis